jgi:hypothetical protein
VTGPSLSRFLEAKSRNKNLRLFALHLVTLTEDQIRALASVSGSDDMKVILKGCCIPYITACRDAFIECIQSDRGPTELHGCSIDRRILGQALTSNTSVVHLKLSPCRLSDHFSNSLVGALAHNRGLVHLDMTSSAIGDDHWSVLCESLRVHPTMTTLILNDTHPNRRRTRWNTMSAQQKAKRTLAIASILQQNTILHTIGLSANGFDAGCFNELVQPRLEANLYRPRILAMKKTITTGNERLFLLRKNILGRALSLHSVRSKPSVVWMFLSHNVDIIACREAMGKRKVE